nr:hypothetical protein [Sulfurimonas sp. SAG-AH-194-C20]
MSTGLILFFVITTVIGIGVVVVFSVDSIGAKIFNPEDKREK